MYQTETLEALRSRINDWKAGRQSIGFVPTMGALHEGHLSLIRLAKEKSDRVVVSIYVNPKQFAPHEDFDAYPRNMESDLEKLRAEKVDLAYLPTTEIMYPDGYATHFDIGGPNIGLDSDHRPHFFNGVATVACKLLNQVRPDIAVFGEKDYQQLCVIRRMVGDLNMGVEIMGAPLIRDENGLALSSRNTYLSAGEYKIACQLNKVLFECATDIQKREDIQAVLQTGNTNLRAAGFDKVDYLELRAEETLTPITALNGPARLLAAGWVGKTRLLDNVKI